MSELNAAAVHWTNDFVAQQSLPRVSSNLRTRMNPDRHLHLTDIDPNRRRDGGVVPFADGVERYRSAAQCRGENFCVA
jgi:hypothetical protein